MDRRHFLKLAAGTGLALQMLPPWRTRHANADALPYDGPLWVTVNASGGWDPLYFCDPKGSIELNRSATSAALAGNIAYAPVQLDLPARGVDVTTYPAYYDAFLSNHDFFQRYSSRMTVLNGVDTSTNNHEGGSRGTWSGRLEPGYPSFAALVAAHHAPTQPLAFISAGGYDATLDLVPLTRISNPTAIKKLTAPNTLDVNNPASPTYHLPEVMLALREAQAARAARLLARATLAKERRTLMSLASARLRDSELAALQLPLLVDLPGGQANLAEALMQQAQVALAAFSSGLAAAGTLNVGSFDTHATHDNNQTLLLAQLWRGVDFLLTQAETAGVAHRLHVVIGSDFGRGPTFNGTGTGGGKDHWPVTSVLYIGPPGTAGNRVIGGTTDDVRPLGLDPVTLATDPAAPRLTPAHVHRALRSLTGITGGELDARFPLAVDDLPLFG